MNQRRLAVDLLGLLGWLLVAFAAAAVGAMASVDAPGFYRQLVRPEWAPPASAFAPVWTALFALMGVSAWRVWRRPGRKRWALALFVFQLAVNALWSWLFFVWHAGALAFVEMLLLLGLIVATMSAFCRYSRLAALLLAPYLAWVAFATVLTWFVWRHNPALLG
ncbi:TspO/MBR family protein [Acidihalobacter prosperus]|uniref:Tryptophan-rich sensory protein n=1 Tax=Acidihalobacter prosperus TaxID=160660 RepID=A0A1A6C0A6_9GAMM|nr:TspO/MBR family protein [Acidihalobacter prosperus]OBS07990.1 tryptophan-rich sensory protein [Acidihalobacter prosperus]